ncbi:protein phosphatase CheZ [Acidithiobacillus sp. AMEEHan]|uniref:protein phosphatase CheZ n=1 Tax=Acidithiobacillus sp. AMEEHan TaxID=2994951 RepID=UPI0027E54633|nr:protein phosphatase CheZ [Acidithiobacillus sp. AMEEHan]
MHNVSPETLRQLNEADLLLREGLRRIAAVQSDLPDAQNPIEEALRLSEEQTMATLAAVERGQIAVSEILGAHRQYIDQPLAVIQEAFAEILASQQAQDLAGQRLKKALNLIQAVESRISAVLAEVGVPEAEAGHPDDPSVAEAGQTFQQADVDALLAELGL